ncbi:MAG TPA: SRPBCC family protein [Clostridia bacterium]|nr:SRPBCC family protein [Clostridia bacterium]
MSIKLQHSVVAQCKPEHVWRHFQDITRWPESVPKVIGNASWTEGEPWATGSKFQMKLLQPMPMYVKPEVKECDAPTAVHWLAPGSAVQSEQWFTFDMQPDETTTITARQEFSGPMTFMFGETIQKQIVEMYAQWMDSLKQQAEQTAREEAARA